MHAIDLSDLPDGPANTSPQRLLPGELRTARLADSEAAIRSAADDAKAKKRRAADWRSARVDELNRIHRGRPLILDVALPPGSDGCSGAPTVLSAYSDPHPHHDHWYMRGRAPDMGYV